MKRSNQILITACLFHLAAIVSLGQDRAILRRDSDTRFRAEVILNTNARPESNVLAALYKVDSNGTRIQIQKFNGRLPAPQTPDKTVFSLDFPQPPDNDHSYLVAVFELATEAGVLSFDLPVTKILDVITRIRVVVFYRVMRQFNAGAQIMMAGAETPIDVRDYHTFTRQAAVS